MSNHQRALCKSCSDETDVKICNRLLFTDAALQRRASPTFGQLRPFMLGVVELGLGNSEIAQAA